MDAIEDVLLDDFSLGDDSDEDANLSERLRSESINSKQL